ncbi:MAG: bifunctional methylenetetrahydrofolate dehydrogenase/methenyltetrahydrofolate cyclohydrolase FolD [Candidatus Aureabacteria bacterium]|nr:bifunctional methylenetetrahydrofolate dehydrogenase/methenyltetrahydrofolate cyclohydrolase FolD [Candidatus Auribacterota bacterium]
METILDGKKISAEIRREVKEGVETLRRERGVVPGLAFITVGEDPASLAYVAMKERACSEVGIRSGQFSFPRFTTEKELVGKIGDLNADPDIHGILIQLPLPAGLDSTAILSAVSPEKDVDGFHPFNMGKLLLGRKGFCPCTPKGIMELLIRSGGEWEGKDVVVVGRSNIVGKPLAALLMQRARGANATVTLCHTGTRNLSLHTRRADIIVVAIGKPLFLTADMVREGAVVIDVGMNRLEDKGSERGYRLVGDVNFAEVSRKAGAITPVPGGVGPMTIAILLSNTLDAARSPQCV